MPAVGVASVEVRSAGQDHAGFTNDRKFRYGSRKSQHWLAPGVVSIFFFLFVSPPAFFGATSAELTSDASHSIPPRELVFVDSGVAGYQLLVDDLARHREHQRVVEIFVLDPGRDGVEQITQVLRARHNIAAVHIVSHGAAGNVRLGSGLLSLGTLGRRADLPPMVVPLLMRELDSFLRSQARPA